MKENSFITILELSEKIGISFRAVEKQITNLQTKKQLKRIGPAKGGHWEINQ